MRQHLTPQRILMPQSRTQLIKTPLQMPQIMSIITQMVLLIQLRAMRLLLQLRATTPLRPFLILRSLFSLRALRMQHKVPEFRPMQANKRSKTSSRWLMSTKMGLLPRRKSRLHSLITMLSLLMLKLRVLSLRQIKMETTNFPSKS